MSRKGKGKGKGKGRKGKGRPRGRGRTGTSGRFPSLEIPLVGAEGGDTVDVAGLDVPGIHPPEGLHATYVPDPEGGRLFLWGQEARSSRSLKGVLDRWRMVAGRGALREAEEVLLLPVPDDRRHVPLRHAALVDGVSGTLAAFRLSGFSLPLLQAVAALAGLRSSALAAPSGSVRSWARAARFALELVSRGRIVPRWRPAGPSGYAALWTVTAGLPGDRARLEALAAALPPAARAVPAEAEAVPPEGVGGGSGTGRARLTLRAWTGPALLRRFLDDGADALVRAAAAHGDIDPPDAPPLPGQEWQETWLGALFEPRTGRPLEPGHGEEGLPAALERWVAPLLETRERAVRGCLVVRAPEDGEEEGRWRVELCLQARDDPGCLLPAAAAAGPPRGGPEGASSEEEWFVRDGRTELGRAARIAASVHGALAPLGRRPEEPVELEDREAAELLSQGLPRLQREGVGVVLPEGMEGGLRPRVRIVAEVDDGEGLAEGRPDSGGPAREGSGGASYGNRRPALSLGELLSFRWEVALGDDLLSGEEFTRLVEEGRPLVRGTDGWLLLGPAEVDPVMERIARPPEPPSGAARRLGAVLTGELQLDGKPVPVARGAALERLLSALGSGGPAPGDGATITQVPVAGPGHPEAAHLAAAASTSVPPAGFTGTLRPYQDRGVRWMAMLAEYGLGGILADEMGLGKTVQLIALLLHRQAGNGAGVRADPAGEREAPPSLVVCPASVLGNWQHELERFAPDLPVVRHHGGARAREPEALVKTAGGGVVLTTYGTLSRDAELLAAVPWAVAALDEAQNVKNPDSVRARAARCLPAVQRLALTGTPVENRLDELWSISEFVNPGLLGSRTGFASRVAAPIEGSGDERVANRLRRIMAPFVLRRLKAEVAADLPERVETRVFCTLTPEQAALYQAVVDEAFGGLSGAEGIQRRGQVLALLTHLKQVVNHPAHYLGEDGPLEGRSGKLTRLTEMVQEVVEEGGRALVFTQYRKMGDLLVAHLGHALGHELPFLHGGVPPERRDRQVREFQESANAPSVFVLSLRAGGTGLNLTRANHVFHFDRWWNPAVEDQATDRAHRIGQTRGVFVHKLVALGTVEERIDRILEEKRSLSDAVIPTGEAWLTELSDDELREVVALGEDTVLEEEPEDD